MSSRKTIIKDICLIPICAVIVALLEYVLTFLPNIQLTVLLLVVFSKVFKTWKTLIIILIYVIIDSLLMGAFSLIYLPFTYLGWAFIPILLNTLFKNVNSPLFMGILAILFAYLYCLVYLVPVVLILHFDFLTYLISDIPFEILLMGSSFISVYWLFQPLYKLISKYYKNS